MMTDLVKIAMENANIDEEFMQTSTNDIETTAKEQEEPQALGMQDFLKFQASMNEQFNILTEQLKKQMANIDAKLEPINSFLKRFEDFEVFTYTSITNINT